jgi:hypothetical protein
MNRWLDEAMRPGPTRQWPMGGGDEAIHLEARVSVSWMSRWGESTAKQGGLRGQRCRCRGGRSIDAMPLLSRTFETRADGAVHRSRIMNSRFTRRVSRDSGRNQPFPLSIEWTLGIRIRDDSGRLKRTQLNYNPIKKHIFLGCIAGLQSIYF